jgi:hypothetical protein
MPSSILIVVGVVALWAGCSTGSMQDDLSIQRDDLGVFTFPDLHAHDAAVDHATPSFAEPDFAQPCSWFDLGDVDLAPAAPTDHEAFYQMPTRGGPTLPTVEAWTVVWTGDEAKGAALVSFLSWMFTSDYWAALGEYGIGQGKAMDFIVAPGPWPTDDTTLRDTYLALRAAGTLPAPNANTALFFVLPSGAQLSCIGCGGYHNSFVDGTTSIPFEVQPGHGASGKFDDLTAIVSHEAVELATDPFPTTKPAIKEDLDWAGIVGELADLCEQDNPVNASVHAPADVDGGAPRTYSVARFYSNAAAGSGTSDPCIPTVARPFFGASARAFPGCGIPTTVEPFSFGAQTQLEVLAGNADVKLAPGHATMVSLGIMEGVAFRTGTSDPAHPEYGTVVQWHRWTK